MSNLNPSYAETWEKLKKWEYINSRQTDYKELSELTKSRNKVEVILEWRSVYKGKLSEKNNESLI